MAQRKAERDLQVEKRRLSRNCLAYTKQCAAVYDAGIPALRRAPEREISLPALPSKQAYGMATVLVGDIAAAASNAGFGTLRVRPRSAGRCRVQTAGGSQRPRTIDLVVPPYGVQEVGARAEASDKLEVPTSMSRAREPLLMHQRKSVVLGTTKIGNSVQQAAGVPSKLLSVCVCVLLYRHSRYRLGHSRTCVS